MKLLAGNSLKYSGLPVDNAGIPSTPFPFLLLIHTINFRELKKYLENEESDDFIDPLKCNEYITLTVK